MTVLKALGIETITFRIVFKVIVTVALFGIAINSISDLYKLSPTLFMGGPIVPDWKNIVLYLTPSVAFVVWIFYHYVVYKNSMKTSLQPVPNIPLRIHKGIVLSLSKPQKAPEDIVRKIHDTHLGQVEDLYAEWSIGQLFKGMYYHRELLQYVWLLMTDVTLPYKVCIEEFGKKFLKNPRIFCDENICHLRKKDDLELIEETKSKLAKIYSPPYLEDLALKAPDIIVDISGGTKPITIGMIMGALNSAIDIQYVEQREYKVIPLSITPEIILDKISEYLLELYLKTHEIRRQAEKCL